MQEDTHNDAYNDAATHEEGIAGPYHLLIPYAMYVYYLYTGPSNHTTRTKSGTERPTKASTKKSRSQASISELVLGPELKFSPLSHDATSDSVAQIQTETHEDDTAAGMPSSHLQRKPAQYLMHAEPGPSRRPAKGGRAKKSTTRSTTFKATTNYLKLLILPAPQALSRSATQSARLPSWNPPKNSYSARTTWMMIRRSVPRRRPPQRTNARRRPMRWASTRPLPKPRS